MIREALEAARQWIIDHSPFPPDRSESPVLEAIDAALRELDAVKPVAVLRVEKARNGRVQNWLDGEWQRTLPVGEYPLYAAPPLRGEEEELARWLQEACDEEAAEPYTVSFTLKGWRKLRRIAALLRGERA